jgi:hypothetical protein
MRTRLLILPVLAAAAIAAGCGGDSGPSRAQSDLDEKIEKINEEVPNVGLGEAGPPPELASGWETDFSKKSIDLSEIQSGGPPKDGIPAIDEPVFQTALDVDWLDDPEPVIAVTIDGITRGYPIQVLMWHEIVNDELAGTPITVTFCPLCNTSIVFDRRVDGTVLDFGTTGNLRNSDLVMYDRQTESWWQQFGGEGIVGKHTGTKLERVPARIVAWKEFRETYPESEVLSRDTGFSRAYGSNPYVGYDDVTTPPFFPVQGSDDNRLEPKERVVFAEVGDKAIAVPFSVLFEKKRLETTIDGKNVVVTWKAGVASALDDGAISGGRDVGAATVTIDGTLAPFEEPFWFAVAAFRPDAEIVR